MSHTNPNPAAAQRRAAFAPLVAAVLLASAAARADDSEIFLNTRTVSPPNVLLVLDTSGSMGSTVYSRQPYDGSRTYSGSCNSANAYLSSAAAPGTPPACTAANFPIASMVCTTGLRALSGANSPGYFSDSMVRWTRSSGTPSAYFWNYLLTASGGTDIACRSDNISGNNRIPTVYVGPVNGPATEWTTWVDPSVGNPASYWESTSTPKPVYTVYSGNYLNWLYTPNPPQVNIGNRLTVVRQAAINLMNSVPQNWNFGLMRYSSNGTGGMVAQPMAPLSTNITTLTNEMNSWYPGGSTPLSETFYEAYLYYAGLPVYYGLRSTPFTSISSSRSGNTYVSPITASCQKSFLIYLTDGQPNGDTAGNTLMGALPTYPNPLPTFLPSMKSGGGCDDPTKYPYSHSISPNLGSSYATDGICGGAVAAHMYNADLSPTQAGIQNVQTYFIGFGSDFNANSSNPSLRAEIDYLQGVASRGGGKAYTATDLTGLQTVFTSIANNILQQSATFVAPVVPVNAFNPTQTLNDVYLSLFESAPTWHWPGNLKKYALQNGTLVDYNGAPAVDPSTQTLRTSAQSFWLTNPPQVDGADVKAGGAAAQLPGWDPASNPPRVMYTYPATAPSTSGGDGIDLTTSDDYKFVVTNSRITAAMLGASGASDDVRANIINYARGEDLKNINNNGLTTDSRLTMGDALHAVPAVVIYGGSTTSPDVRDAVIYRPDNDGMLHAISGATGQELWAFIPPEALGQMASLYADPALAVKHYVLDGSVRVLKFDVNNDGVIDMNAGDRVIIYFGQGRGGSNYYAMDVTDRTRPKLMWSVGPGLPNHGQAWSTPTIANIKIAGANQNSQKLVLVITGGYDPLEDATSSYRSSDSVGNAIYFVDALYGTLLWSASNTGADLNLAKMHHAIPSDILTIDTNTDGFVDRMYVGDMAGQVWRFDITNGNPRSSLVAGGVIASLGGAVGGNASNNRRFYNAPDAAFFGTLGHAPYLNISIGSGYRGHPLNTDTTEYFYAVRDYKPFTMRTQADFDAGTVYTDSNMVDITSTPVNPTIPEGSPGWKLGFSGYGEKVLSSSVTFNNVVLFTTYTPGGAVTTCSPSIGVNRYYAVNVWDGSPALAADRFQTLTQAGIAPNVTLVISNITDAAANRNNQSTYVPPSACSGDPTCTNTGTVVGFSGSERLKNVPQFGSRTRTYWNANDAQ
jgi:type IV pilus assembly protein PilY1